MTIEKSCGAIVFTRICGKIYYVIIKHIGACHGFPKGHMENDETEAETALREIYEETGLEVEILKEFREETMYPLPGKVNTVKKVVYFLAEYTEQEIDFNKNELESAMLMTFNEALSTLEHENLQTMLCKAHEFVCRSV